MSLDVKLETFTNHESAIASLDYVYIVHTRGAFLISIRIYPGVWVHFLNEKSTWLVSDSKNEGRTFIVAHINSMQEPELIMIISSTVILKRA